MSTTKSDGADLPTSELGRVSELACDEALFGLHPALTRELDEAGDCASQLRGQLALVTSGLALRDVGKHEALPANVRSLVQAQAFSYFERRVSAPPPTATTTGSNVVELGSPSAVPPKPSRRWLSVLALAACFAAIGFSVRGQLPREWSPSPAMQTSPVDTEPLLAVPLRATRLGAAGELAQIGSGRELTFSLSGAVGRPLPSQTSLWIHVERSTGRSWQLIAPIEPDAAGAARLVFDPGELLRVLAFAVTTPERADPRAPDLENAPLEARVGD